MKKKFILLPAVGLLLYVLLSGYAQGPDHWGNVDGTGATTAAGCYCHNLGIRATTTIVALELDSAGIAVTHYTGGHAYVIKITGTNTSGTTLNYFGFQLGVIKAGTTGGTAVNEGTFPATVGTGLLPANTQKVPAGTPGVIGGSGLPIDFVEHTEAILAAGGGPYIESIPWTAPATGTGSVTIYGAINAVNFDGAADAGDLWNNNNVTICENVSAITGTATVCPGATTTLSDATTGGTWSSSSTATATVTTGGVVTGVLAGTAVISYNAGCSGTATTTVTVNTGTPISGALNVCQGATTPLTDGAGTWSSSVTSVATVSASGVVGGVTTGSTSPATTVITFTPTAGGCTASSTVTVNPLPAVITGTMSVCQGAATTLTETTSGGTWSSGATGIATVSSSGSVGGVITGTTSIATAVITYTSPSGCTRTTTVTVNPLPAVITGTANVCQGATTTLNDASGTGTWSSGSTGVATISASGGVGGVVTGSLSPATSVITYNLGGCTTTTTVTVNAAPPAITGTMAICAGTSTVLSDGGGTWSSSSAAVASINSTSGLLTGGASPGGTAIITFTSGTGCTVTTTVTVNPQPVAISGPTSVCAGATATLTDGTSGGTWSSSNTTVASIGLTSGSLTAAPGPGGTTNITYSVNGCTTGTTITINPSPAAITGAATICAGAFTTLSDATSAGTWSSGSTGVATITLAGGVLTGNTGAGGTSVITYSAGTGCSISATITVNPLPQAITGTLVLCPGIPSALADITTGGTWSSSSTGTATVTATGSVTGTGPGGTAVITYTANGCATTTTVTVNAPTPAITGTTAICAGGTTTLSNAVTGGTWSSSTTVATIGSTSGVLTGSAGPGGTSVITYTPPTGCATIITITVSPIPPAITGIGTICAGTGTTLTDGVTGGTWSSSSAVAATIDLSSGIITGSAGPGGTTLITYTSPAGCIITATETVNPLPPGITGTATVCSGSSTTLSDAASGGTWSSGNTAVATVVPGAGSVSGIGTGNTATISYTAGTGCTITTIVTVNPLPPAISGTASICTGLTSTLSDAVTGGTWSSSNTATATVTLSVGLVTGAATGTSSIVYTLPTGCTAAKTVTVNPLPLAITGASSVCVGLATTLGNSTTGGTWSSGSTGVATVGLSSGSVTGAAPGTATITYTVGAGCAVTTVITVNPLSPITGATSICTGLLSTLADATGGGTWSSSNAAAATVVPGTGQVTAVAPGTTFITYLLPTGCAASSTISVVSAPPAITGVTNVCTGALTTLADGGGIGTWSSSNTSVATVVPGTGNVSGVFNGTSVITFSLGGACSATTVVTVNPLPGLITGTLHICSGSSATLADGSLTGTWSSSDPGTATVDAAAGTVSGLVPGTSIITYTLGTGCTASAVVTINSLPAGITGANSVCTGAATTLSDATGTGTWSSSATGTATVSATGVVTGEVTGTATIIYTLPVTGCTASITVTVNSLPPAITGTSNMCVGATTTLADGSAGGTWSSSATGTATVDPGTGAVSGLITGTATITYSLGAGCTVSKNITVNILPSGIAGPATVCMGSAISLTDVTPGGTWSSSNHAIATVLPGSGTVTSVSAGIDTISYTVSLTGCSRSLIVNVNETPAAIAGPASLCLAGSATLTDATTGGTWSSSASFIASVGSGTGLVSGLSPGPATITYRLPGGCSATTAVTVDALPAAITGPSSVCFGSTITLADATAGGTWSNSSGGGVTAIDPATGVITTVTTGTDVITYTAATGCTRSVTVIVNTTPSPIFGAAVICPGTVLPLTDAISGGTWSSSAAGVASVDISVGIVTAGTIGGTATITYSLSTGCSTTAAVTVNPATAAIGGSSAVCVGATTALTDLTLGGTWSSSATATATIDAATGIVTGLVPGTSIITYTPGTGCTRTTIVTVNAIPAAITGPGIVCAGATVILADPTGGGTWSSASAGIATAAGGVVTGVSGGLATINYTVAGCSTITVVTVNATPSAITGTTAICAGATTTLADVTLSGTWSSSAAGTATVGAGTGIVSGVSAGSVTISYTNALGCSATSAMIINPLPAAISGAANVCAGATIVLSDGATGGVWTSSSTAIATTISGTGLITGVAAGTANITYTLLTGCTTSTPITVNASPSSITGTTGVVCQGTTVTLGDAVAGGTWSSSSAGTAAVSGTGVVTGAATGTAEITYALASGCSASVLITVTASPAAITGATSVCEGLSATLSDATTGGVWSSGTPATVSISIGGSITGVSAGAAAVSYTLSGCAATANITVSPLPAAITGAATVCTGATTTLADATGGGTWSSSSTAVATVGVASGIVTGVSESEVTITYTLPTGCVATFDISDDCNEGVKQITSALSSAAILPNPNIGDFTIVASLAPGNDETVFVEITDMIGKTIYKGNMFAKNGKINGQVSLGNNVANGMYLLTLHSGGENTVLHFVVEK